MYTDPKVHSLLNEKETPETSDYTQTAYSPEYRRTILEKAFFDLREFGPVKSWDDFKDIISIAEKYYSVNYRSQKNWVSTKDKIKRECYQQHWDSEECNC
jgi:hypothetical protein